MNEEEKKRQLDLIEFEQNEIGEASLKEGEDEQLEEQYRIAANSKNIAEALSTSYNITNDTAYDAVDRALREMITISEYDSELKSMADILATASDLLSDFGRTAREYLENNMYSEETFKQIEDRLNVINHLKAKYGKSICDVLSYKKELEVKYENMLHHDMHMKGLKERLDELQSQLQTACEALSKKRKQIAKGLTKDITAALIDLNFLDVRFDMVFEETENFAVNGKDHAYFIISTNIGEEMKPLWQVAGPEGNCQELCRAMKSCLADATGLKRCFLMRLMWESAEGLHRWLQKRFTKLDKNIR